MKSCKRSKFTFHIVMFPLLHTYNLPLQVLGAKYQSRLLEAIDARLVTVIFYVVRVVRLVSVLVVQGLIEYICSQLPEFFGGLCTCSNQGGCLRSNKGPWSDPLIMKVVFLLNLLVLSYCIILMVQKNIQLVCYS